MVKSVVGVALVALLLAPLPATAQTMWRRRMTVRRASSTFMCCRCHGRRRFAPRRQSVTAAGRPSLQCGARPYSFVVHGLWPQYDKGFPEYCGTPAPRLSRDIVSSMLDLMPAPHLIYNEWDKHGTCSGLSPHAYFDTVRQARAAVKIPPDYIDLKAPLAVAPGAVADAFIKANAGLSAKAMAVECDHKRLTEVRLCLAKDFSAGSATAQFHDCPEVVKRSCRRDQVVMPPVRGG